MGATRLRAKARLPSRVTDQVPEASIGIAKRRKRRRAVQVGARREEPPNGGGREEQE